MQKRWKSIGLIAVVTALVLSALASATPYLMTVPIVAKIGITPEALGVSRGLLEVIVRKSGHIAVFILLGFGIRCFWAPTGWSLFGGLLWAVLDEFHQTFVPGRDGEVIDVLIDFSGVLVGVLLAALFCGQRHLHHTGQQHYM